MAWRLTPRRTNSLPRWVVLLIKRSQPALLGGLVSELGAVRGARFLQDLAHVELDRVLAQVHIEGDLAVRHHLDGHVHDSGFGILHSMRAPPPPAVLREIPA